MASRASEYTTRVRYICTLGLEQPAVFCLTSGVEGWFRWLLAVDFIMVLKYGLRFSKNWLFWLPPGCSVLIPISSSEPFRRVEWVFGLSKEGRLWGRGGAGPPGRSLVRVLKPWWVGIGLLNAEKELKCGEPPLAASLWPPPFRRNVMAFLANLHHL